MLHVGCVPFRFGVKRQRSRQSPARYLGLVALTAGSAEYSLHHSRIESASILTTGCLALPFSLDAIERLSKMCPIVFDSAMPIIGWLEFGSSYATATRSPLAATLTLAGFLPNTIGTGEWNVAALSMECAKNIPAPL